MRDVSGSARVRASLSAVLAGVLLALCLPSIALAANTATLSAVAPKHDSVSRVTLPRISVTVYDRYGVKGSKSYAMYVDGVKVKPTISYVHGYGYRKFKLSYTVRAPLAVATHVIKVTVHDLKGRNSSYTWDFMVDSSAPSATFSALAPAHGSVTADARVLVSATVADRWDVSGAGAYSMTIDGIAVPASISYAGSGDLTRFTVSYRPAALAQGEHTAVVTVHDKAHRTASTTWSFTVWAEMPLTIAAGDCAGCHAGYPAAHPMDDCSGCHGASAPTRPAGSLYAGSPMSVYGPSDLSAHAPGCAAESSCHGVSRGGTMPFPHVLGADCARCHSASYPAIPQGHTPLTPQVHAADSPFCAQADCHSPSLTIEHYKHTGVGGARLSCTTCHQSDDPNVRLRIAQGGTACEGCHTFSGSTHEGTGVVHALPVRDCTVAGCHSTRDLAALHSAAKGSCLTCHAPGKTATADCGTCHSAQPHVGIDTVHTNTASTTCTAGSCHGTDVIDIHTATGGPGCAACHAPDTSVSLQCTSCHPGASDTAVHAPYIGARHTPTAGTCVSPTCHSSAVDVTHAGSTSTCAACHEEGVTPSIACATCHTGSGAPNHRIISGRHTASEGTCVRTDCHATDVAAIHAGSSSTCQACHASGITPSTDCSSCHFAVLVPAHVDLKEHRAGAGCAGAGCHDADVSVIHAAAPNKCGSCHKPGATLTTDCSTAGCHSGGTLGLHSGHTSTVTTGTIAIDGVTWTDRSCSECHKTMELQAAHGEDGSKNSCATCHPVPVDSITTWNGGCAQGNCHAGTSPVPFHADATAAHETTPGATIRCGGDGCHGDVSSLATIHAGTDSNCAACHDGDKLTADCASCHDAHDIPAIHAAALGSAAFTINGEDYGTRECSDCHTSSDLVALHGGSDSCGTCHPTAVAAITSSGSWAKGCVQAACHTGGSGAPYHADVDPAHVAPAGSVSACGGLDCHGATIDLAAVHAGTKKSCDACHAPGETPSAVCTDCHSAHDLPAAHAATPAPANLSVGGGFDYGNHACSECHSSLDLRTLHSDVCVTCHDPNVSTVLGSGWTGGCAQGDCHASGTEFQTHLDIASSHETTPGVTIACGTSTCHGDVSNVGAIHHAVGCDACHNGEPLTKVCADCHDAHDLEGAHAATLGSQPLGTVGGYDYGSRSCSDCHSPADYRDLHGGDTECGTCHPRAVDALAAPTGGGCVAPNACHTTASAAPMHAGLQASHETTSGVAASCGAVNGPLCHADVSNLAGIHRNTDVNGGCARCHNGDPLTNTCADCHTTHDLPAAHMPTVTSATFTIYGSDFGTHACSECHATDLRDIHGGDTQCATCHPTPVTVMGEWDGTCTQASCHSPGVPAMAMHTDLDSAHGVIGDALDSCNGAGCHDFTANAALIHQTVGCDACHDNPDHQPSLDCLTCHGPDDPHASLPAHAVDGMCVSSTCHVTEVVTLHNTSVSKCAACHAEGITLTTTCYTGGCHSFPATRHDGLDAHVATGGCVSESCHASDLIRIHAGDSVESQGPGCAACHADGITPASDCGTEGCHDTGAPASHASHPSTVTEGTFEIAGANYGTYACSTCHETMELQAAHGETGAKESCSKCHPSPRDSVTDRAGGCVAGDCHAGASPIPMHDDFDTVHFVTGPDTCIAARCHGGNLMMLHSGTPKKCGSCHDGTLPLTADCTACHADPVPSTNLHPGYLERHTTLATGCTAAGCHSTNAVTIHTSGPTAPGCRACHASSKPALTLNCTAEGCHSVAGLTTHESHPVTPASQTFTISLWNFGSHACAECHPPLDLIELHAGDCASCHPDPASTAVFAGGCVQGSCHASTGTLPMHGSLDAAHDLGTRPSCEGPDCHGGGISGMNVAAFHETQGCATCHGAGRPTTLTCATATCHSDGDSHPASNPHPAMTTGHTTALSTDCVSAGCHASDLGAVHAMSTGGPGCIVCHGAEGTLTSDCSNAACHPHAVSSTDLHPDYVTGHSTQVTGCTVTGCHSTSAITIHTAGPTPPGCPACHGAGKPALTLDCTTCHTQAHAASHQWCNDCHGGLDVWTYGEHGADPVPDQECANCHGAPFQDLDGTSWVSTSAHLGGCSYTSCHNGEEFGGASPEMHTVTRSDTCTGASCHAASLNNLTTLHPTCATCHAAGVRGAVKNAIADGNKACSTCHAFTDHAPQHDAVRYDSCSQAGCHLAATNLLPLHPTCATCHDSPEYGVQLSIGNGDTNCAGCHYFSDHSSPHAVTRSDSCVGASCHVSSNANLTTLHPTCATCHSADARQAVKDAIAVNDLRCSACHAFTDHTSQHVVTRSDTCTGAGCHLASLVNLTTLHPTCATCHGAGLRQQVKDAITANNKACSACHVTTVSSVTLHPTYVTTHTVDPAPACTANPACHAGGANVIVIHQGLRGGDAAVGCAACHAAATQTLSCFDSCHSSLGHTALHEVTRTDSCDGSGCHPDTLTNLADLHPSCDTCHGTGVRQTVKDAIALGGAAGKACSACHGDAHAASHAWCATCHDTGAGGPEHYPSTISGRACSTCHGTPFTPISGVGGASTFHVDATLHHCAFPACHGGGPSGSGPSTLHLVNRTQDTCAGTGCHLAGDANLTTLHVGGCGTCHDAGARQAVKDAVAAKSKACSACHTFTNHTSQHAVTRSDSCVGASCHAASLTNLTTLHPTCATCHDAGARQEVKDAITVGDRACATCHAQAHAASHQWCNDCHSNLVTVTGDQGHNPTYSMPNQACSNCHGQPFQSLSGIATSHSACDYPDCHHSYSGRTLGVPTANLHYVARADSCAGPACHPVSSNNLTTLHPTCATCHVAGARQAVKDAIAAGNKTCSACHTFTDHTSQHTVTRTDSCVGAGCHIASLTNLTTLHPTCATCHGAGLRQAVKDAITANNKACSACHGGADPHPAHPTAPVSVVITINGTGYGTFACSTCHANDLRTLHGGLTTSCVKCHPAPRNSFTTYNDGCVQGNCHAGTSPLPQHGSINAAHTVSAPTCTTSGCHSGGGDLAKMHSVETCSACHGGSKVPTQACATAGCHGSGDSVPFGSGTHAAAPSAHAAAVYNYCNDGCHSDCYDCHDGSYASDSYDDLYQMGADLPGIHGDCASCHTPGGTGLTDCGTCHDIGNMESEYSWM